MVVHVHDIEQFLLDRETEIWDDSDYAIDPEEISVIGQVLTYREFYMMALLAMRSYYSEHGIEIEYDDSVKI
ncbi:MAG: hypothetical protein IKE94_01245 [Aeriscardovia sp.]|nr:hypothetical protein [Aeriscardovia sp.]